MEEKNPLVSIIVRTKDRPKLLKRALQSISAQTYRPIEVVLVNDGGCDLPEEELKEILGDVSLNYIKLEKNTGRAHAGNVGIENSSGEYIGFLDDDDEFYPEHVETLITFLRQNDYIVAYTDALFVYKNYDRGIQEIKDVKKELAFSQDFDYDRLVFENYMPFMCLLFERDVLKSSGGFDSNFDLYEDWDLLIRIGDKYPFYHIRKTTANYNQWDSVMQISQRNKDYIFLEKSYLKVLSKHINKFTEKRIHSYISNYVKTRDEKIKDYEKKIKSLEAPVREKEIRIKSLEVDVKEKDLQIESLKVAIKDKYTHVQSLENALKEKDDYIQNIHSGHGWKLLTKYYRVRDRLFPLGTRRREGAKLIFSLPSLATKTNIEKTIKYLRFYGFRGFYRKAKEKLALNSAFSLYETITSSLTLIDFSDHEIVPTMDVSVSVVIPTKNAGEDFNRLLAMIKKQKGFRDIEIIVVDSGSTNATLGTAKEYGAKIVEIPSERFSHSYSRNLGAENASGEYLFFTVQDALLPSDVFFYELIGVLKNKGLVAVSCAEFPKEDSDLFYRINTWIHYNKLLGVDKNDRILCKPDAENYINLRKNGQINDIACFIERNTFLEYKYKYNYAEDLDLGIRLIKNGHKLALLGSVKIIHSHDRPSYYYLKRGYVDNLFLSDIFPDYPMPTIRLEQLFWDIIFTYSVINSLVHKQLAEINVPCNIKKLYNIVTKGLDKATVHSSLIYFDKIDNKYIDDKFKSFLEEIYSQYDPIKKRGASYDGILINAMLNYTQTMFEYFMNTFEIIDDHIFEEFKHCIFKTFAFQCGGHIAFSYLGCPDRAKEKFWKINNELSSGV